MSTARRLHHTYQQYLEALELSAVKLEYCDGEIYAMAGGTPAHAELAAAVIQLLRNQLGDGCHVYSSDLKVRIEATDLSTFPDVSVVCGPRKVSPKDSNAVVNPTLIVEVTSDSTEDYDRGEKLSHYQQLPSLRAILFVSHKREQVSVIARDDQVWRQSEFRAGQLVTLRDPELRVPVGDIYGGVEL